MRYIVEILATLPYTVADEPLYIITCLNRTISFVGGNLLSALKALFPPKKKGQTEEVEVNPKAISTESCTSLTDIDNEFCRRGSR